MLNNFQGKMGKMSEKIENFGREMETLKKK